MIVAMYIFNIINHEQFSKIFILKSSDIDNILPWQFFTYAFVFNVHPIFFIFTVLIFMLFSSVLERLWGSFHYMIFLLITILSKSISSFLFGPLPVEGDFSLYLCLMIAFGFNFPEERIYFFIIPVRVKILAIISMFFVPIQIFLMFLSNKHITGFLNFPLEFGIILTGILSYLSLIIYYKKIFYSKNIDKLVNNLKNSAKDIENKIITESKIDKNKKYSDILESYNTKKSLNNEENIVLESLDSKEKSLCDEIDFIGNDRYCLSCDKYGNCVKRKIENRTIL